MNSQRKFTRYSAPFYIKLKFPEEKIYSGIAKDVSYGGLKVVLDKSILVTPQLEVELFLLFPWVTLSVNGKIVWVKEYDNRKEIGICFIKLPDAYKEEIYNYVFRYYPQEVAKKWWQM